MDTTRKVEIRLNAKDQSQSAFASLTKNLQAAEAKARLTQSAFDKFKTSRGMFQDITSLAVGGGGAVILATKIKEAADKSLELRRNFAAGVISGQELLAQSVRQIPVMGQIVEAWDSVVMLMTTSTEELKKQNRELQAQENRIIQAKLKETRDTGRNRIMQSILAAGAAAGNERHLIGLEGDERTQMQALLEKNAALAKANEFEREIPSLAPGQQKAARAALEQIRQGAEERHRDALRQVEEQQRKERDAANQKLREEERKSAEERSNLVEQQMRERRQHELEKQADQQSMRERAAEAASNAPRLTGRADFESGGLLTGQQERAMNNRIPEKQLSVMQRVAVAVEKLARRVDTQPQGQAII